MRIFRSLLTALSLVVCTSVLAPSLRSQTAVDPAPTADSIMARVAENQDRAEEERSHYVYVQHARVASRKGKTVMCEETTDSRITPSSSGSHVELLKLDGRLLRKKHYVTYTTLSPRRHNEASHVEAEDHAVSASVDTGDDEMDRDLVENMRSNFMDDKSKDGIAKRLFPLTSKGQGDYLFHLVGREHRNGRDVFHIEFRPKDESDFDWKGDAYIDAVAFQPVVVRTELARKVPLAVRTLLGTNVPGLGFTIVYAPQPDGVWFPVNFGTEFKLHVLFFFKREILIHAENREFEKTHVSSKIVEVGKAVAPQ